MIPCISEFDFKCHHLVITSHSRQSLGPHIALSSYSSGGFSILPVEFVVTFDRCSACAQSFGTYENNYSTVATVYGVVPVAAVVPVFPAGPCRHYRGSTAVFLHRGVGGRMTLLVKSG